MLEPLREPLSTRKHIVQSFPDGVTFSAKISSYRPTVYTLSFAGLDPRLKEKITIYTLSCGVTTVHEFNDGMDQSIIINPSIPEVHSGLAHVTARRACGCVTLYLPWTT